MLLGVGLISARLADNECGRPGVSQQGIRAGGNVAEPDSGSSGRTAVALSAAQLNLIASSVASQRQSIAAMQAQLRVFDEQLAMRGRSSGPLAESSKAWAELEGLVTGARRDPGPEG